MSYLLTVVLNILLPNDKIVIQVQLIKEILCCFFSKCVFENKSLQSQKLLIRLKNAFIYYLFYLLVLFYLIKIILYQNLLKLREENQHFYLY